MAVKEASKKNSSKAVTAVKQTEPQIWNEIRDNHSALVKVQETLTEKVAEVKELKAEEVKLAARERKLLNVLSGVESYENQGTLPVMDQSSYKSAEELRRHPQEDEEAAEGVGA